MKKQEINAAVKATSKPQLTRKEKIIKWTNNTVVPFIANVIIVALALKGSETFFSTIDPLQKAVAGIIVVALLVFVAYNRK